MVKRKIVPAEDKRKIMSDAMLKEKEELINALRHELFLHKNLCCECENDVECDNKKNEISKSIIDLEKEDI
jgi:hypothetical protein